MSEQSTQSNGNEQVEYEPGLFLPRKEAEVLREIGRRSGKHVRPLLRPEDAAKIIGVSRATLSRMTADGKIPHIRMTPHVVRYRWESIEPHKRKPKQKKKSGAVDGFTVAELLAAIAQSDLPADVKTALAGIVAQPMRRAS